MRKKDVEIEEDDEHHLEIIKAVAQAWHGHSSSSSNSRPTNEFDAYKRNFKTRPSRFKLEASAINTSNHRKSSATSEHWDFQKSLWDSYEIVTVSKRLEAGLVFDPSFSNSDGFKDIVGVGVGKKKHRESKNSLRSLFSRTTSKRFGEPSVPNEDSGSH